MDIYNCSIDERYVMELLEQCHYLCNGELREWHGSRQDVFSPVRENGAPRRLGSYPLLTEQVALEVLEAACRAYDYGRGDLADHAGGGADCLCRGLCRADA